MMIHHTKDKIITGKNYLSYYRSKVAVDSDKHERTRKEFEDEGIDVEEKFRLRKSSTEKRNREGASIYKEEEHAGDLEPRRKRLWKDSSWLEGLHESEQQSGAEERYFS